MSPKEFLSLINLQTSSQLETRDIKVFFPKENKPGKAFIFLKNREDMERILSAKIYTDNEKKLIIFRKRKPNGSNNDKDRRPFRN